MDGLGNPVKYLKLMGLCCSLGMKSRANILSIKEINCILNGNKEINKKHNSKTKQK